MQRTLRFARCPKCKQRSHYGTFVVPYVLSSFAAIAIAIVFAFVVAQLRHGVEGAAEFRLYFPLGVTALVAICLPVTLIRRWRTNDDRIRWLDF